MFSYGFILSTSAFASTGNMFLSKAEAPPPAPMWYLTQRLTGQGSGVQDRKAIGSATPAHSPRSQVVTPLF